MEEALTKESHNSNLNVKSQIQQILLNKTKINNNNNNNMESQHKRMKALDKLQSVIKFTNSQNFIRDTSDIFVRETERFL